MHVSEGIKMRPTAFLPLLLIRSRISRNRRRATCTGTGPHTESSRMNDVADPTPIHPATMSLVATVRPGPASPCVHSSIGSQIATVTGAIHARGRSLARQSESVRSPNPKKWNSLSGNRQQDEQDEKKHPPIPACFLEQIRRDWFSLIRRGHDLSLQPWRGRCSHQAADRH